MYRATGHVNTHKGMIFTLGIFSAAAGRCIQEDGTVTLQSTSDGAEDDCQDLKSRN